LHGVTPFYVVLGTAKAHRIIPHCVPLTLDPSRFLEILERIKSNRSQKILQIINSIDNL
jgi:hypothetical protein